MSRGTIAALCLIPVLSVAGVIDHTCTFSTSDIISTVVDGYDYVSIQGFDHVSQPGHPALPVQYLSFVIPPDAQFEQLEVIQEGSENLTGTYTIYPAQKPVPTSAIQEPEFTLPDARIYSQDVLYPEATVRFVHEGNLSGYRIISVALSPLRYNPVHQRLALTTGISFRIHYRSGVKQPKLISESHLHMVRLRVRQLVVNDHQVEIFSPPSRAGADGQSEYVIITDPSFVDDFERLRQWKMRRGVTAEIITTSEIYANYTGDDYADQIRNYIRDAAGNGAQYFLLAGQCDWENNEEYVPRRDVYCWTTGQGRFDDEDTIPCDMYYSDLDGTWDADGNGTYGDFPDSVDMYSNVYVGRAPVKNAAQIAVFIDKVIAYEANPSLDYAAKALLATGNYRSDYGANHVNDSIADMMPDSWQKAKLYQDYGLMSREIVRDSINQGFHLSNMLGHGSWARIYYHGGYYYDYMDPSIQTNETNEGIIVTSGACLPGAVDHGWLGSDYDCLAERMVNLNDRCALATLMNTRYGWSFSHPDCITWTELVIVTFYEKLFKTEAVHLGEVLAAAKDELVPIAADDQCMRWCVYTFALFGDPEMPVWTDRLDTLIVMHPPVIDTGAGTFAVTVLDGDSVPLTDALVCCYIPMQSPEMQVIEYTDASGTAVLDVSPQTHGDTMFVTVYKHNYRTYPGYALVQDHGPYLTAASMDVVDANDNGQVNNGEYVELGIWARNWGVDAASSVFGYLSSNDPYVEIGTAEARYGRIAAHDSALNKDYYTFTVANDCPNRHVIAFDVEFQDRHGSTWTSQVTVTVRAPVLLFEKAVVTNDDNGNGALEPGEQGALVVTLKNEGDAIAHSVLSLLTTSSEYITINDPLGGFGSIEPGATADNSNDPYDVTADPEAPYLTNADFSLLVSSGVYQETFDFSMRIGLEPPTDTGYYYAYWSGGPHTQSPVFEWVAIDSTQSQYPGISLDFDAAYSRACVDLPFVFTMYERETSQDRLFVYPSGMLSFFQRYGPLSHPDTSNSGIPDLDGPRRMAAALWDCLEPGNIGEPGDVYYYYDEPNHRFIVEWFKIEHFPGGDHETFEIIFYDPAYHPTPTGDGEIIVQYLTAPKQSGFTAGIENGLGTVGVQYYYDGEYYPCAGVITDSCAIRYTTFSAYPDESSEGPQARSSNRGTQTQTFLNALYPNPFTKSMVISYQIGDIARTQDIALKIYDITGRLVKQFNHATIQQSNQIIWNGCDDAGRTAPAGVYFVNFETDNYSTVKKAILLR